MNRWVRIISSVEWGIFSISPVSFHLLPLKAINMHSQSKSTLCEICFFPKDEHDGMFEVFRNPSLPYIPNEGLTTT